MKSILRELNDTISARGSMVVAQDGMLIAAEVCDDTNIDRLAALGASIVTNVGESLQVSGWNGFKNVEIAAEQGKVILAEAGPTYLLVLVGARLEVGVGSIEIQSAANRLARAADLATN